MHQIDYWLYVAAELECLQEIFATLFSVEHFDRDYENVWEWIEGNSGWLGAHINIRRPHDWDKGCYDTPLQITITTEKKIHAHLINEIGEKISKQFKTIAYSGNIVYGRGDDNELAVVKDMK